MTTPKTIHLPRQVVRPTPQRPEPPYLARFAPTHLDTALIATGALVIALTVFNAAMLRRSHSGGNP